MPRRHHRRTDIGVKPVPFLDLGALHAPLEDQLDAAWRDTLVRSSFIGGPQVEAFERDWATYCGTAECIGVANGTDALELILTALGVGSGDDVIVPANTFVATAEAVVNVGATPVFVDVDEDSLLVTASEVERSISARTAAVVVVDLYGQVPDMDPIAQVASDAGIHVVEDAAQAHGAALGGRRAGTFGRAAAFSFYPGKNLGALGDAGAVVTDDAELAARIRSLANHGRESHLVHGSSGRNSRLDGIQAAALSIKLTQLDAWNDRRRAVHSLYAERFAGSAVRMVSTIAGSEPVHHLEVVRVAERDRLRRRLAELGIETGVHYALPCHKHPAFTRFDRRPLPVAESAAEHQLSLPIHPTMTVEDIETVAQRVLESL